MKNILDNKIKDFLKTKHIFLIGFMGSGKSFLGQHLAGELENKHLDTDLLVEEREGKSIFEIFKEKGEAYFRASEKTVLQNIVYPNIDNQNERFVISTGGGMPLKKASQKLMNLLEPVIIFLNPPFETLFSRVKGSKRPLVYRKSRMAIFRLWSIRAGYYQRIAHITISNTALEDIYHTLNERIKIFYESHTTGRKI